MDKENMFTPNTKPSAWREPQKKSCRLILSFFNPAKGELTVIAKTTVSWERPWPSWSFSQVHEQSEKQQTTKKKPKLRASGYNRVIRRLTDDVTLTKETRSPKTRLLTLLKFPGRDGDVFFILNHFDYGHGDPDDELQSHNQYFFEEHSCPTNWLRDTAVVVQDGDQDPHGFLSHVRTIRVEKDFDEDDYELIEKTFPEVKHAEAA